MRKPIIVAAAILFTAGQLLGVQKPKPGSPGKPALTQEEKEILQNRDILENLDLLQNMEKFRMVREEKQMLRDRQILENLDLLQDFEIFNFFEFFAGETAPGESAEASKPAEKETGKNEK